MASHTRYGVSALDAESSGWLSPVSYWLPTHFVDSAWLEHAPFASWLVSVLRPRTFVELGTHIGFSYFAICEAVDRLGLETKCFAVDTWEGDDHAGFYSEAVFDQVNEVNTANYAGYSQLIRGYFDDAVDEFEDGTIDLLHIDGRHGYEDVKHDFESWRPKLSNRAVVLFHDVEEHREGFGVWKFWAELSAGETTFTFLHGHGLGVLLAGDDVPEGLQAFFQAAREHEEDIRRDYSTLGGNIVTAYGEHRERLNSGAVAAELAQMRSNTSWKLAQGIARAGRFVPGPIRRGVRRLLR